MLEQVECLTVLMPERVECLTDILDAGMSHFLSHSCQSEIELRPKGLAVPVNPLLERVVWNRRSVGINSLV